MQRSSAGGSRPAGAEGEPGPLKVVQRAGAANARHAGASVICGVPPAAGLEEALGRGLPQRPRTPVPPAVPRRGPGDGL